MGYSRQSLDSMKLFDALKEKGNPYWIPNSSRNDLPEFFVELGHKTGVEVGVDEGEYTESFAKVGLSIYGVDPWKVYEEYNNRENQPELDSKYDRTRLRLAPYPNSHIIRKTSMEALTFFKDNSLDFVYIDGNHKFRYVAEDICEWTKKVRKEGIVSGHDYEGAGRNRFVTFVLEAYLKSYNISNWYVIGDGKDITLNWMFVKHW